MQAATWTAMVSRAYARDIARNCSPRAMAVVPEGPATPKDAR